MLGAMYLKLRRVLPRLILGPCLRKKRTPLHVSATSESEAAAATIVKLIDLGAPIEALNGAGVTAVGLVYFWAY